METRTKVFLGVTAAALLYGFTRSPKVKLRYRATSGSENGLTGVVEWVLELPGKTLQGVRGAETILEETYNAGDYTFLISNQSIGASDNSGFPVNFNLLKGDKVLISVGMMPVLEFVGAGWVEESEKAVA